VRRQLLAAFPVSSDGRDLHPNGRTFCSPDISEGILIFRFTMVVWACFGAICVLAPTALVKFLAWWWRRGSSPITTSATILVFRIFGAVVLLAVVGRLVGRL